MSNERASGWLLLGVSGLLLTGSLLSPVSAQQQLPGIIVPVPPASPPPPVIQPQPEPATPQPQVSAPTPLPTAPKAPTAAKALTKAPPPITAAPAPFAATQPAPAAPAPAPVATPQAPQPVANDPASVPGTLIVRTDAYAPVTTITAGDLAATPGSTITDALQLRPGVAGSTFAPGASRPIIRGLDNFRVRTQENGIATGDVSALSEDHGIPVDPFAAQTVEVIRGPAALRYGSQTVGGVVSVENDRIPSAIPRNGYSGEVRGGLNSIDNGREGAFRVTAGSGNFALHADGFKRRADDYGTPQGRQVNSFVDSQGHSLGASFVGRDGFFGVSYTRYESLYGIPGGQNAGTERPRIDMQQDKVLSKGEWRVRDFGIDAIKLWLGYSIYSHNEVVFKTDADTGIGTDKVGSRFTNREQEGRVEISHLPFGTLLGAVRGSVGVQWGDKRTIGSSFEGGDNLLEPATTNMIAAYVFEELRLSQTLRLQAAGRIERQETKGVGVVDPFGEALLANRLAVFTPTSSSIGALYDLPLGVVARLTAQHSERAPQAPELFSKGAHEATGTFEIGNPDLKLEKANSIEAGFSRSKAPVRFDVSTFYTRYHDFIFRRLTGQQCDDTLASCGTGSELNQLVFGQRDATFYGAELATQIDVLPIGRGTWGFEGQYDFVRAHFSGDVNVPRIPPHRLGGGLFYRDDSWLARVFALHAFRQDTVSSIDPKDTPTNGYTLLNAELSYTWRSASDGQIVPEMTIGLKGNNLLDDDVRNHVSFKKDEVLQPGRTFKLFGSVKFN